MLTRLPTSPPNTEGSDEEMAIMDLAMNKKGSNSRRRSKKPVPDEKKDETYWKRRQKNNMAAKRSREARRQKESELTNKNVMLEIQHEQLR